MLRHESERQTSWIELALCLITSILLGLMVHYTHYIPQTFKMGTAVMDLFKFYEQTLKQRLMHYIVQIYKKINPATVRGFQSQLCSVLNARVL